MPESLLQRAARPLVAKARRFVRARPALKARLLPLVRATLRGVARGRLLLRRPDPTLPIPYFIWAERTGSLREADRAAIRAHIAAMPARPLVSVVMPAYDTPEDTLRRAIASVRAQLWQEWELCVADDASPAPHVGRVLAEEAARDGRIRWERRPENGHISAASNTALAMARGEWTVLMDHDDLLAPHALYAVAAMAARHPGAQVIYSDEDHVFPGEWRDAPYFKSRFDPELLLAQNVVSHLGAYRTGLLRRIGGFRPGFEGSQDHDLALRCLAEAGEDAFAHVPEMLYHWRSGARDASFSEASLERCIAASRRAVEEHLAARGIAARVEPAPLIPQFHCIRYALPDPAPAVSVVIPTRDRASLLGACLGGVLERTDYPALEVLVVDNGSAEPETLALFDRLRADARVRVLPAPGPFNYARLNNLAAREARGELLLLLNNDTEVTEPGWLREMAAHAIRPGIGAVGAKLLYPDGTVQHGGVVLGFAGNPGVAWHFGHGKAQDDPGAFGWLALARSVSAVTGACLMVKRADYLRLGGLDEEDLAVAFNDVDFCLRLQETGLRNLFLGPVSLLHHESKSRGAEDTPEKLARFRREEAAMHRRWGAILPDDPWWNPNLDIRLGTRDPVPVPRRPRLWADYLPPGSRGVSAAPGRGG